MSIRKEQKQRTRRALLDAALSLLSSERVYSSLSLREVTRAAELAPTSFYRHFDDMNELGLALVEEAGLTLRQLFRKARKRINKDNDAIGVSVDTFVEYLLDHQTHFRLLIVEQAGNTPEFRETIRSEINNFTRELATYLAERAESKNRPPLDTLNIAKAMTTLTMNLGAELLDTHPKEHKDLIKCSKQQLALIMLGGIFQATSLEQ
jgi:AcrR family transcriptional regulator